MTTVHGNVSVEAFWTRSRLLGGLAVAAVILWGYYSSLDMLVRRWSGESDYIYGFLVVPFAGFLLYQRRHMMPALPVHGNLWGLLFLAAAGVLRVASAYFEYQLLEPLSLIPCLAGVVLLVTGWDGMRWCWPSVVFLAFMVPLPGFLADMLSQPLREIGAAVSTYLLQTFGVPAAVHGTIISLSRWELGVEEACSGLKALMLFLAVCTGAALVMHRRPKWERVLLVVSSIPIAVIANVIRITVTGVLYELAGPELAEAVFHGLVGLFMMPVAVVLLWLEMILLSYLFPPSPEQQGWL